MQRSQCCHNVKDKQRSGQGVVMEQRCEKTTVSLHCDLHSHNSCVTELTLRGGGLETLFWFHAQTSSRGAGLKELKVDVSGSQWHASAGTILTPLNLSDPSVPALSLPQCGSSKISLLQGATNYEGVNEVQRKVFCFSFSRRVKKQNKTYFLLHLTFKSQHSGRKKNNTDI